jgi:ankyrin repeat protein
LHHAAEVGSVEAAALLIAKAANPTLKTASHKTPFEIAIATDHPAVADILPQNEKLKQDMISGQ